ncbi:MAG TPA: hypothetical protein VGD88_15870 [Opitutaceae bacterium]
MPFSYTVQPERRLIHIVGQSASTTTELNAVRDAIMTDPAFDRSFNVLIELDKLVPSAVDFGTLINLARARENVPGRRMAVVAPDAITYGLAKVYEAYGRTNGVRVFRVKKAAVNWIAAPASSSAVPAPAV